MTTKTQPPPRRRREALPVAQRAIVYPRDVEQLFNISAPTRWRWENKTRKLPPRDVILGGQPIGWRPATLGLTQ